MLSMTVIIAFAQPSLAQVGVPQPVKTVGFISVAPELVGVGQEATVNLWVFPMPTTYGYLPYFKGFNGITVTFVKPDGTKDTFKPVDGTGQYVAGQSQSLGAIYFFYKPDMAGNWSVSWTMPEQNITDSSGTVIYSACTSKPAYFTVQTDTVLAGLLNGYPWSELPNSNTYWSYPINSNNREWSKISGDWLVIMNGANIYGPTYRHWQPYGSAPNTPHVVWSNPYNKGGIIGGDYGSLSDMTSSSVDKGAVVMNGKVFYNIYGANQFQCVDQATGKILYTRDGSITGGIHLPGNALAQNAIVSGENNSVVLENSFGSNVASYIYQSNGTTWIFYDTRTGTLVRSIFNCSSARLVDNTNLAYGVAGGKVFAWDMSQVVNNNWPTGKIWERPLPTPLATARGIQLFAISADLSTVVLWNYNQYWAYSAKDGTSKWNLTLTYPVNTNEEFDLYGVNDFIVFDPTETTFKCYSLLNGNLLWTSPSFADSPWASTWTVYNSESNDYDNLYLAFPDGTMAALSLATGKLLWRSTAIPSTEYPNNAIPFVYGCKLVGGCLYTYGGYSLGYNINPIPRFSTLVCINATTGDIKYTLNGGVYPAAAANGYIIGAGVFDGNMYCIGKGPTSTTLAAQQQVGGSVLIQGLVLDNSPVSFSADLNAMFPNGVPAISDANMSVWMDYLHMQNSTLLNNPPQCTGVPVTLTAVDPNGNSINIGTTTSNSDGHFAYQWTPTTAGLYTIYATFGGTDSYFASHGVTSATVASAASPTAAPTSATQPIVSNSDMIMYFAAGVVVIIIAIAVATVLLLRKK
jgi:hypothetical protein